MIIFHLFGKRIPSLIASVRLTNSSLESALKKAIVTTTHVAVLIDGWAVLPREYKELLTMAQAIPGIKWDIGLYDASAPHILKFSSFMERLRESKHRIF